MTELLVVGLLLNLSVYTGILCAAHERQELSGGCLVFSFLQAHSVMGLV